MTSNSISHHLDALVERLVEIRTGAAALAESKVEAGQAKSISDLRTLSEAALDNLGGLRIAVLQDDATAARELGLILHDCVVKEIAGATLVDDLRAAVAEAEADLAARVGIHRNPYKSFIDIGGRVVAAIADAVSAAAQLSDHLQQLTSDTHSKEVGMAKQDEGTSILAELEGIGRQLSFLGTSVAAPRTPTGTSGGAGSYRSVSAQLIASLDALALPHHGVQFTSTSAADQARGDLIEGLLDAFRTEERDGNTHFVPGPSEDRRRMTPSSQILSGAARVAARLVRAEADNILDILDRLPDMTRFRIRQGLPSAKQARDIVAERFQDLDEVMLDAMGVNRPRARFALRRIAKAIRDFFDYANLERELGEQMTRCGGDRYLARDHPCPFPDDDEIGQRRSVVQSEELRREIAEVVKSFKRLKARVLSPLSDSLGTTAARLEQTLTVVNGSALALRDIMVRSGSSLPEQDVQLFSTGIEIQLDDGGRGSGGRQGDVDGHGKIRLSTGQLLDWILEVSEPYVGAVNRSTLLEVEDFVILADELDRQADAVDRILHECHRLGFAFRLPGPLRQLEELSFYIRRASELAEGLTEDASQSTEAEGTLS